MSAPARSSHARAVASMVVAAVCWSSGGFLVRQLSITDAWQIVFWRSAFMTVFVAGVLGALHRGNVARAVRSIGAPGVLAGAFLAGTFFFYIGSLTRTTVANTNVLMSVSPFLAALAGRWILREAVPPRTWIAMSIAVAGVVVMFAQSLDSGRLVGNLLALGVSCCFAAQLTVLRKFHATLDLLPQVLAAGVISLAVAAPFVSSFAAPPRDFAWLALMGCLQLGAGCLLATAASRQLSAAALGLLALLEPILGPVWVWALMNERPPAATVVGGSVVLAAVFANEAFSAWSGRAGRVATA